VSEGSTAPADDAASSPHEGDGSVVEGPAQLLGGLPEEHEALGVGDDLGGVQALEEQETTVFTHQCTRNIIRSLILQGDRIF